MKKIQISVSDDAHILLLSEQFERKKSKKKRTTLVQIAGDLLEEKLFEDTINKKATQK